MRSDVVRLTLRAALATTLLLCLSIPANAQQVLDSDPNVQMDRKTGELNISIALFDPGIPADKSTHRRLQVYPPIREIEALFLPFVLRETLFNTGQWGVVRVVPDHDIAAEILISGRIIWSDGEKLNLHVRAVDSSGFAWIDKEYVGIDRSSSGRNAAKPGMSGYQDLYDEVADDLLAARNLHDAKALDNLVEISLLRYAGHLVPSVFGDYLKATPDGLIKLNRLPAENDPIVERIERIRNVEYVITDAVDKKFRGLHAEIASTYDLWRKYRRQYVQYQRDEAMYAATSKSSAPKDSFEAIKKSYDNYKWARLATEEQDNWAKGFENEVSPLVDTVQTRVGELEGWIDQHYEEWDRMLTELFLLENSSD